MCNESSDNNERRKMDGKTKHPFAVICRECGSNDITITAFEYLDLEICCNSCGKTVSCGRYHTLRNNYSHC